MYKIIIEYTLNVKIILLDFEKIKTTKRPRKKRK